MTGDQNMELETVQIPVMKILPMPSQKYFLIKIKSQLGISHENFEPYHTVTAYYGPWSTKVLYLRKPTIICNERILTKVYSYTHDAHLPHPQFNGRNEVTAYLTNVASVDIQMKFKHQKWIAREIGVENWEETEIDNCDTYQKMFADKGLFYNSAEFLNSFLNPIET